MPNSKKCLHCGLIYNKNSHFSRSQWQLQKYCSKKCFCEHRSTRIERRCLFCNKKILVKKYLLNIGSGKFCDAKCYSKWQSKHRRLEKSFSWKGGVDDTYRQNARAIIKRLHTRLICSVCGRNKSIVVHHIDRNVKNNDISNLKVLCQSCHVNLHNEIAKKTKKDRAVSFLCCVCHKTFYVNTKADRKVCSSICSYEYSKKGLHWRNRAH